MNPGKALLASCVISVVLLVSACSGGGGGDGGEGSCTLVPNVTHACGNRITTSKGGFIEVMNALSCPLCTVTNPEYALDDDPNTFAQISVPAEVNLPLLEGGVTLLAHGPSGTTYNSSPGVTFSFESVSVGGWVFVHTSTNGEPYPAISSAYQADPVQTPTPDNQRIYWLGSGMGYDTVEVTIGPYEYSSGVPPVVGNLVVNVYEICSSSRVVDVCIPDEFTE